jgi:hypothetical protein
LSDAPNKEVSQTSASNPHSVESETPVEESASTIEKSQSGNIELPTSDTCKNEESVEMTLLENSEPKCGAEQELASSVSQQSSVQAAPEEEPTQQGDNSVGKPPGTDMFIPESDSVPVPDPAPFTAPEPAPMVTQDLSELPVQQSKPELQPVLVNEPEQQPEPVLVNEPVKQLEPEMVPESENVKEDIAITEPVSVPAEGNDPQTEPQPEMTEENNETSA